MPDPFSTPVKPHPFPLTLRTAFIFSILIALFAGASASFAASDNAQFEQVKVHLLAERQTVQPDSTVLIGLEQKIIPHWHTYWQNPGDSGMATSISWQLPAGASAGPIQWPIPSRHKQGVLTNYGYSDQVILLSAVHVPGNLKPGTDFNIVAKANWLVCEEICIPQQAELGLTLKIAAKAGPANTQIQNTHAALPQDAPWPATVTYGKGKLQLRVASPELIAGKIESALFFPHTWGKLNHGAEQAVHRDGDALVLDLQPGEAPAPAGEPLEGLLVIKEKTGDGILTRGFNLKAEADAATPAGDSNIGLLSALLLALAGGIILNLMPCVFPVLSIKALALIRHGAHADRETRLHGVAYTAGIVLCFLILAGLLLALRSGGAQIGWGYQFQTPGFVLIAAWLMFAIGLSLSGVFEIGTSITNVGGKLTERSGYAGSFFTGMLATVVATPCTAPFMGVAIGYALTQPALPLLAIFVFLGLGLALPFLLLSNWPLLQRCLPKPGLWMERLKQFFAFPMYATAVWLVWVLNQQTSAELQLFALGGMVAIAFAAWIFDSTRSLAGWRRPLGALAALAIIGACLLTGYQVTHDAQAPAVQQTHSGNWEPYSEKRLQELRSEGKPVFLNFTAAWCITCLANERVALSKDNVIAAFKDKGITYLKGDWTNQDAEITKKLAEFGRNGVPLYVYYPADKNAKPVVLPQLLTPEIVLEHIHANH